MYFQSELSQLFLLFIKFFIKSCWIIFRLASVLINDSLLVISPFCQMKIEVFLILFFKFLHSPLPHAVFPMHDIIMQFFLVQSFIAISSYPALLYFLFNVLSFFPCCDLQFVIIIFLDCSEYLLCALLSLVPLF